MHRASGICTLIAGVWLISLGGCRTANLSGAGAQVATSQSAPVDLGYPPASCRSLGFVVGRGGGSFGGGWLSNENLVKYAMNDLQNSVAKMGGNFVQHDTPQMGVSGNDKGTTTTTATVSGTAYYCDPAARSTTTAAAPPKPKLTAPPEGAGGFRLGEASSEAQSACTGAGHQWKRTGDDAECDGTLAPVGTTARSVLHLCADVVCGIDLLVTETPESTLAKYDEIYGALERKYGIPKQKRASVDADCAKDLGTCLSGPSAPQGAAWRWPDGNLIEVRLTRASGAAAIGLTYANPTRSRMTTPGPTL